MIRNIYQQLHKDGKYPILALISLSSIFSLGLLAARMLQTGTPNFFFMVWNLFLGLLPIVFSLILTQKKNPKWLNLAALILWLGFFPNAPYMLTDLLHLRPRPEVPFWYDLMVFLSFAWTGLIAAYYSLFNVIDYLRAHRSEFFAQLSATIFLALASYGVYLGRFRRWNTWDIIARPGDLVSDLFAPILHPTTHFRALAMSATLFVFLILGYLTLQAISRMHTSVGTSQQNQV